MTSWIDAQAPPPHSWTQAIVAAQDRRGFLGGIPYLSLLHLGIPLVITVRLLIDPPEHGALIEQIGATVATSVLAALVVILYAKCDERHLAAFARVLIPIEIVLISWAYASTGKLESTFFLFYLLPLLTAAEYLPIKLNVVTILSVAFAFTLVVSIELYPSRLQRPEITVLLVKVFGARIFFFILAGYAAMVAVKQHRNLQNLMRRRAPEMTSLLEFETAARDRFDASSVHADALAIAVRQTGADVGAVWNYGDTHPALLIPATAMHYISDSDLQTRTEAVLHEIDCTNQIRPVVKTESVATGRTMSLLAVRLGHTPRSASMVLFFAGTDSSAHDSVGFVQALAGQADKAISRVHLLNSLCVIGPDTATEFDRDLELDATLHALTTDLRFDFAMVSLVEGGRIRAIRGHNVPKAWLRMSDHSLDSNDIDAFVVRTRETLEISGADPRLSAHIYERFRHRLLTRIFTPILDDSNTVIGVLEAGCPTEAKEQVFLADTKPCVEDAARALGSKLGRMRRPNLLQSIASHAMAILGADSASIHLVHGTEQFRAAGAGLATAAFLAHHRPRERGIGRRAMETGEPKFVDDPTALAAENESLYQAGVRAIAAFPLLLVGPKKGVLYVHFWREHSMTDVELRLGSVFARQIEIVVQNELLSDARRSEADLGWALSELQHVIQTVSSTEDLNCVLKELLDSILNAIDADCAVLYQYHQDSGFFDSPPTMAGHFLDSASMKHPIKPSALIWQFVEQRQPVFCPDIERNSHFRNSAERFHIREKIRSMAAIPLRNVAHGELVGLLFVNYRTRKDFAPSEKRMLTALACSAAIAISSTRLRAISKAALARRQREVESMDRIDRAIVGSVQHLTKSEALKLFLAEAVGTTQAKVGAIMWLDDQQTLRTVASHGHYPCSAQAIGDGIVGAAADSRKPYLVKDVRSEEWIRQYKPVIPDTRSELAVPILDKKRLLGVLNLEHPDVARFDEHDQHWIDVLITQLLVLLHSLELNQQILAETKYRIALAAAARRIHNVDYTIELAGRLLLGGVTSGAGLGFSRAMLFLHDDRMGQLQGAVAVGAQSYEQAVEVWSQASVTSESIEDALESAEQFGRRVQTDPSVENSLTTELKKLRVGRRNGGALWRCLQQRREITVSYQEEDSTRDALAAASLGDRGMTFTCVPLFTADPIGVLLVDNRFLPGERDVDLAKLGSLRGFADLLAIYIENARLRQRNRIRSYQILVHQIKGPANIASGIVRKALEGAAVDSHAKALLLQVQVELTKMIRRMRNLQLYSDLTNGIALRARVSEVVVDELLGLVMTSAWQSKLVCEPRDIAFHVDEPSFDLLRVRQPYWDNELWDQAFQNVLENAVHYSRRSSVVRITAGLDSGTWVVSVASAGVALREDEAIRCLEAGWRSEAAQQTSSGTGIGLYVVDHCMRAQGGYLSVKPTNREGITEFSLVAPCAWKKT